MELRLVLDAVGIGARAEHHGGEWVLIVPGSQVDQALAEIDSYREENASQRTGPVVSRPARKGAGAGVAGYIGTLLLLTVWDQRNLFGLDWQTTGEMNAGAVMAGQVWRCFTAR